jgi:hypothetical protein
VYASSHEPDEFKYSICRGAGVYASRHEPDEFKYSICCGAGVYASSHEPVISGLGIEWAGRGYCHGTLVGALVGVGVILSYLVLFVSFYLVTVPHTHNSFVDPSAKPHAQQLS